MSLKVSFLFQSLLVITVLFLGLFLLCTVQFLVYTAYVDDLYTFLSMLFWHDSRKTTLRSSLVLEIICGILFLKIIQFYKRVKYHKIAICAFNITGDMRNIVEISTTVNTTGCMYIQQYICILVIFEQDVCISNSIYMYSSDIWTGCMYIQQYICFLVIFEQDICISNSIYMFSSDIWTGYMYIQQYIYVF